MAVHVSENDQLGEIIGAINTEIFQRTRYGTGTESSAGIPRSRVVSLVWANGSESWYCSRPWEVHPDTIQLDANEVLVLGLESKQIEPLLPFLKELPLFRGSFEAKERGKFSLSGIEIPPAIKSIPPNWHITLFRLKKFKCNNIIIFEQ